MKAAVVTEFGGPLIVKDIPIPQPAPEQVLVKMETSGVCHTDIHAAQGDWPAKPTLPFVPGHEGIGVIEAVGSQVSKDRIGERVAIAWLGSACGECDHCVSGWETLCDTQQNSGYSIDGAYAEYAVAHAKYVVHVPDGISSFDAAPLTCAGVTTYKAVKVGGVTPAQRVAIFGVGGLGHMAVQYAKIAGGFVTAVDIEDEKLDLAQELGADHTVNSATTDPVEAFRRSVEPMSRSSWPSSRVCSIRPSGRYAAVDVWCACRCRRTACSRSRSSRRWSAESRYSARSSAPGQICVKCSHCTRPDERRYRRCRANSTRSTTASTT